jgi:hypothetical protein
MESREIARAATLIGDLVGSREFEDRSGLQRSLDSVLDAFSAVLKPLEPLEATVGDEFQGVFADPASSIRASLLLRLWLQRSGGADSRYGLGHGEITFFEMDRQQRQDGPGWWTARTAIDRAKRLADSPRTQFVRTCFESDPEYRQRFPSPEAAALNAFLVSRDAAVGRMKPRGRRLLLGLMLGRSQAEIADEEGITQSAVSQNLNRSGAFAIQAAQQALEGQLA